MRATLSRQEGRIGIYDGRVRKAKPLGSEPVIAVCQSVVRKGKDTEGFLEK